MLDRPHRGMALSELLQSSRDDSVPSQSTSASATGRLSSSSNCMLPNWSTALSSMQLPQT